MIEIIPNWHPVFVHFTIGLLIVASLFHVVAAFNSKSANYYQFENVANWNLWVGTVFAVITVVAGWFAFNSVDHDTPSHLAMIDHRNWALGTTALFILLAIWSFRRAQKAIAITWLITVPLLVASGLLGATGWKGGELVYRHGLGVMSLPDTGAHDHAGHDHGDAGHSVDQSGQEQSQHGHEAEHEVGEIDHAHDHGDDMEHIHGDNVQGTMEESKSTDEPKPANETMPAAGEQPSADGHDHDHDHGDHTH